MELRTKFSFFFTRFNITIEINLNLSLKKITTYGDCTAKFECVV